jgi:hypothetical protein
MKAIFTPIIERDHGREGALVRHLFQRRCKIEAEDLAHHNWAVAFRVACDLFAMCSLGAQAYLLNHSRHGVRAAAEISRGRNGGPDPFPPEWVDAELMKDWGEYIKQFEGGAA